MAPKDGRLSRRQRVIPIAAAAVLVATGLVVIPMTAAHAAVSCSIAYTQSWSNQSQFGANVVINNTGDPVNGWSLVFNFPNSATIQNGWPVAFAQSGTQVTISSNDKLEPPDCRRWVIHRRLHVQRSVRPARQLHLQRRGPAVVDRYSRRSSSTRPR